MTQKYNYMICPACGRESSFLTLCDSCEWEDLEENEKHQKLLNGIRPYAGNNAYLGHGCMVCPECENDFYWKSEYCPVHIFYNNDLSYLLFLHISGHQVEDSLHKLAEHWKDHSWSKEVLEYRVKIFKKEAEDIGMLR